MKTRRPTPRISLTAVLGTSLLTACGSSSSGGGTQAPPAQELPDEFSVFIADFELDGITRPYLFDLETGERRQIPASLPAGTDLLGQYSYLSPDGRILALNLESSVPGERVRIVDLETGSTFTPSFPSGVSFRRGPGQEAPPASPEGNDPQKGDSIGGIFRFSADSSFALIQRDFFDVYLADGNGRNITRIEVNGGPVEIIDWIGDTNRVLMVSEDATGSSTELSVFNAETGSISQFTPAPGEIVYVDEVVLSANGEVALLAMEASGTPGQETEDVVAIELSTGTTTRWTVPELDDRSITISADGSHAAFLSEDNDTGEVDVFLADRSSGAMETVSAPAVDPMDSSIDKLRFEPGGDRLAYLTNHRDSDVREVKIAEFGAASILVDPSLPTDAEVSDFAWSPVGGEIAYFLAGNFGGQFQVEGGLVYVYDADSSALPVAVNETSVADTASEFTWSPTGQHLLLRERLSGTIQWVSSTYASSDLSVRRELGAPWREGLSSETPENFRSVRFSPDGERVIWRALPGGSGSGFLEALDLWTTSLAEPAGTEPMLLTEGAIGGAGPVIENFWLREKAEAPAGD